MTLQIFDAFSIADKIEFKLQSFVTEYQDVYFEILETKYIKLEKYICLKTVSIIFIYFTMRGLFSLLIHHNHPFNI